MIKQLNHKTYLKEQDKKEYNFTSKQGTTPLLPITGNVFSYLLINKLTQLQNSTQIGSGSNEYFLAKAINIQKEKHINRQRLEVFLNRNNIKNTDAVNYKKIGYNKYSIYTMLTLMKKDRFFLNEKFYQDVLGRRAYNVYTGGILGYEKNLKLLKKYNEYFERQIFLISEKVDTFFEKNTAITTGRIGDPYMTKSHRTTPIMGWKWNTEKRAYLEIWKRINARQAKSVRSNIESFYFDENAIKNIEDLSLMALKNLRDYELYFGMQFYKKEIKRFLSKAGVGRSMYLSVFSRNATRFNFLKDTGYRRNSSSFKSGVATNYGLLKTLYTKKHFPKTALELANSYFSYSFFNTEVSAKSIEKTIANAGKFNRKKENNKVVKVKFIQKDLRVLTNDDASSVGIKKINIKRGIRVKENIKGNKKIELRKFILKSLFTKRKFNLNLKFKSRIRHIRIIKNSKNKTTLLRKLVLNLNKQQLKSLIVGTLFKSFSKLNYIYLSETKNFSANINKKILAFKVYAKKNWKRKGMANRKSNDQKIKEPFYALTRMRILGKKSAKMPLNYRKLTSLLKSNTPTVLGMSETKLSLASLRYMFRAKKNWKKAVYGLLGLKLFAFKNERIILGNVFKNQNKTEEKKIYELTKNSETIKNLQVLKKIYNGLLGKNVQIVKKRFKENYTKKLENIILNKNKMKTYDMSKTLALMGSIRILFRRAKQKKLKRTRGVRVVYLKRYRVKTYYKKFRKTEYSKYSLTNLFKYGYSHRVNQKKGRMGLNKKTKLKIIYGTANARKIITKYLGKKSNPYVGASSLKKVKNKIGKLTIFELGIHYNNAKAKKITRGCGYGKDLELNLKFNWNLGETVVLENNSENSNKLDIKKKIIVSEVGDYFKNVEENFTNKFFFKKQNVKIGQVSVYKENLKQKNIDLIKKYLGLVAFGTSKLAARLYKKNLSKFYSKKQKINFTTKVIPGTDWYSKKQRIKSQTQVTHKKYPNYLNSLKRSNLTVLNQKLGITENLKLLDVKVHDHTSIFARRDYLLKKKEISEINNDKPIMGVRELTINKYKNFVKIQDNFPEVTYYAYSKTNLEKFEEMKKEEITTLSDILDKKRYEIRNQLKSRLYFNTESLVWERLKNLKLNTIDKRTLFEDKVATFAKHFAIRKSNRKIKMWEHDFGAAMSNTWKRLGKYMKSREKSILRTYCPRKLSFLNRRNSKRTRRIIRKWVMGRKVWRAKLKMHPVKRLKVKTGRGNYPIRLSGAPRIKLEYPSAPFLKNLLNRYRRERSKFYSIVSNDVEHDYYRGFVSVLKTFNRLYFKQNYRLQIKKRVFGDIARKRQRMISFRERNIRSKYTRKLYKQFGMRRYPTFWYRIARKKFPLKNKKKEWAIKIPLAERFIFPFDRQVWNTTYDSSIVYHKNIGWLNFSKKIRRLRRIKSFYRYGREEDEAIAGIPLTTPHKGYMPRSRNGLYDRFFKAKKSGLTIFRNEFSAETKKRKKPLNVTAIDSFYKEYGVKALQQLNYEYMSYRDSLVNWNTRLKPIMGYSGLKTYYTYNSYIMKLNTEIKTRRYKTLFSNFAFAFKLNKTDFTKNIINFNFTQIARDVFTVTAKNIGHFGVKNMFNYKHQYYRIARALSSKYRYFGYSNFTGHQMLFKGKQIVESLVKTNRNFNSDEYCIQSNPIIKFKNDSKFVETFAKFRFRNKVLRSSQNLQLRFINQEARLGLRSFSAKNVVW